jgi:hypothetical protein
MDSPDTEPPRIPSSTGIRMLIWRGFVVAAVVCLGGVLLFNNVKKAFQPEPIPAIEADPIVDIWINRMLGYFFVFLPDKTVKLYQSYSFDLEKVGQWWRVEDRPIYPESPKVPLPSYKVEFGNDRVMDIFRYSIAHHTSIVVEDRTIGRHGYNRLSDVDDPDRFYREKFTRGLSQELSIVNNYWKAYHGRPHH